MKKTILIAYDEMYLGGSTTSLLALLNNLDRQKYEVFLQLYTNTGCLFKQIPEHIHILPQACKYTGVKGTIIKLVKGIVSGEIIKAWVTHKKNGLRGFSLQVLTDLKAKHFSAKPPQEYDIAIGFLEFWPVRYVAHCVKAKKKFGWLHSTFANLAAIPELEIPWLEKVDHVVFVADSCRYAFEKTMPQFAEKAITIENITDSNLLRKRANEIDSTDEDLILFRKEECFKIVTVCRTTISVKGLDRAINCAKQLKAMGYRFLWMIIGEGEDLENLRQMIVTADISDCMRAIGKRNNPFPYIKAADVFCMLSRYEGKPMAITESMILGTPPVVTRYLSASEQIQNEMEGIIVENEDDSAIPALKMLMDQPQWLNSIKEHLMRNDYGNSAYVQTIEKEYFD